MVLSANGNNNHEQWCAHFRMSAGTVMETAQGAAVRAGERAETATATDATEGRRG